MLSVVFPSAESLETLQRLLEKCLDSNPFFHRPKQATGTERLFHFIPRDFQDLLHRSNFATHLLEGCSPFI